MKDITADSKSPIKVCVLFDGLTTEKWIIDSIKIMLERTNTEISLVVINKNSGFLSEENILLAKRYPAYSLFWLSTKKFRQFRRKEFFDDPASIFEIEEINEFDLIECEPERDGLWNLLPEKTVEKISEKSDIVIRFGFGLLKGDVLTAAKHGVLSYHHGNPRKYRGTPVGFWQYMNDESEVGVIVQRLNPEIDAGEIYSSENISIDDCKSWFCVRKRMCKKTTHLLANAIENLRENQYSSIDSTELGKIYRRPSAQDLFSYFGKEIKTRMKSKE